MFERFTDRARKVMALANQEAQRFNHEYIGPEHILLGLVKEGTGVGANVLKNLNVDLRKVRLQVEMIVKSGPDMVTMGKLPQTPTAKLVIAKAIETARDLSHNYVGTEHILIALVSVVNDTNAAREVLKNLGVEPERAKEEVISLLGKGVDDDTKASQYPGMKGGTTFDQFFETHVVAPARRSQRPQRLAVEELMAKGYYLRPGGECKIEGADGATLSSRSYELFSVESTEPIQVYVGTLEFAVRESLKITEGNSEQ